MIISAPSFSSDNAAAELLDLCRADDRAGFDALASALMPAEEVDECWAGARRRLGLEAGAVTSIARSLHPERPIGPSDQNADVIDAVRDITVREGSRVSHIIMQDDSSYYCVTARPNTRCPCGAYRITWELTS